MWARPRRGHAMGAVFPAVGVSLAACQLIGGIDDFTPMTVDAGKDSASHGRVDAGHPRDAGHRSDTGHGRDAKARNDGTPPGDARVHDGPNGGDAPRSDAGRDAGGRCTSNCPGGDPCALATECASGVCSRGGACTYPLDCADLLEAGVTTSGAYTIQPSASAAPISVYCDMADQGGGWTLVLKMGTVASPGTFDYGSAYWTNAALLNPTSTDMSQTEAKLASYSTVPFANVLAMMEALGESSPTEIVVPVADTVSLSHLIVTSATNTVTTNLSLTTWTGLTVPSASIQSNCNRQGINIVPVGPGCAGSFVGASVRIGLIANNQNNCCNPDSYIGFGGDLQGETVCDPASLSAGSMEGVGCSGGPANIQDFGFIFVR